MDCGNWFPGYDPVPPECGIWRDMRAAGRYTHPWATDMPGRSVGILRRGAKVTVLKTAWQLAKEQWIPAAVTVAVSGVVWGYVLKEGKGWTIGTVIGVASPWAAFIGSLVANWFRVRKGQKTETTLSKMSTNVQHMLSNLDGSDHGPRRPSHWRQQLALSEAPSIIPQPL